MGCGWAGRATDASDACSEGGKRSKTDGGTSMLPSPAPAAPVVSFASAKAACMRASMLSKLVSFCGGCFSGERNNVIEGCCVRSAV